MANTIGYGQGAVNNTNAWGQGAKSRSSFSNTQSIELDGTDDYVAGSTTYSELNNTTQATWSYWVKPTLGSAMVLSRVSSSTSTSAFVYMFYLFSGKCV